jgi:hypothetical protein
MSSGSKRNPDTIDHAPQCPRWTDVFAKSSRGSDVWYVKGSREIHEGLGIGPPGAEERWDCIVSICEELGLASRSWGFGGPGGGGSSGGSEFRGLDGVVSSEASEAFYGAKGAWVSGRKLLRLLCYEMGLSQPARNEQERKAGVIPTHEELLSELAHQLKTERDTSESDSIDAQLRKT